MDCWTKKRLKTKLIKIKDGFRCNNFGLGNYNLYGQKKIQNKDPCQFTYSEKGDKNSINVNGHIKMYGNNLMTCVYNPKIIIK